VRRHGWTTFPRSAWPALLCALAGCNSGGANQGTGITVSPGTATVTAGDAGVSFSATLSGLSGTVSWSVNGPGSVSPFTGLDTFYSPPAQVAAATTVLVVAAVGAFQGIAEVAVEPLVPSLVVSPSTVTVKADGGAVEFTATLTGASGIPVWTLTGPGVISPGLGTSTSYTPPDSVAAATTVYLTAGVGVGLPGALLGGAIITVEPP
jgi:hypothetical protein